MNLNFFLFIAFLFIAVFIEDLRRRINHIIERLPPSSDSDLLSDLEILNKEFHRDLIIIFLIIVLFFIFKVFE